MRFNYVDCYRFATVHQVFLLKAFYDMSTHGVRKQHLLDSCITPILSTWYFFKCERISKCFDK